MRQGTFEKEILIHSDAATVIDAITDYSQYRKIDPLIFKVERAQDAPPGVRRFLITEGHKWGPFKFKTRSRVDVITVAKDTVYAETHQPPAITATNVTKVMPENDGVVLHETVTLRAPDMLFSYAFRQANTAREEMLGRIKQFVENK